MKKSLWFILMGLIGTLSLSAQSRIIGGYPVDISQRPYQAAVLINGLFNGGGVIINSEWILTAAHVVKNGNTTYQPGQVSVSTGVTDLTSLYAPRASVSQIIVHPDYNPSTYLNDIALIKLSSPLTWNDNRQPIPLIDIQGLIGTTPAIVSGWGQRSTSPGSSSLNQLYATNLSILASSGPMLASLSSTAPFFGDSGGPLTIHEPSCGDILIGLVSHGPKNDPTKGVVNYTHIGYYQSWIATNTGNSNSIELRVPSLITRQEACTLKNLPANTSVVWNLDSTKYAVIDNQGVIKAKGQGRIKVIPLVTLPSGLKMVFHGYTTAGIPLLYITLYNKEETYPYQNNSFAANSNCIFVTENMPGTFFGNMQNLSFDFHWSLKDYWGHTIEFRSIENVWMRVGLFGVQLPSAPGTYIVEVEVRASDGTYAIYSRHLDVDIYYRISSSLNSREITVKPEGNTFLSAPTNGQKTAVAQLYNANGIVRTVSFHPGEGTVMDTSSLPNGFYYLLISKNGKVTQRQTISIQN